MLRSAYLKDNFTFQQELKNNLTYLSTDVGCFSPGSENSFIKEDVGLALQHCGLGHFVDAAVADVEPAAGWG